MCHLGNSELGTRNIGFTVIFTYSKNMHCSLEMRKFCLLLLLMTTIPTLSLSKKKYITGNQWTKLELILEVKLILDETEIFYEHHTLANLHITTPKCAISQR